MIKKLKKIIIIFGFSILLVLFLKNISNASTIDVNQVIEEGTYVIKSAMNTDYSIGVAGASKNAGANVELQRYVGSSNQKFIIKYISNGYYTIQAEHSNNFLDVEGASKNIGANVDQWPSNYGGDNQKWLIKSDGNGYYYIISKCNELYIDVEGAKCVNGANIDMWASNGGGNNQKFKFERVSDTTIEEGTYVIKSAMNTDYSIGVAGASKNAGANVELQKYVGSSNQKFIIKYISNGYYTIQAEHSNNFLDVEGAAKNIGANVDQWPSNYGGDNQKWLIKSAGNDYYYIISKCNDLYMDVEGAKCNRGANIDMWASNGGGDNQKFKLEKASNTAIEEPNYEKTIEEGIYTIKSAMNTNYSIGIEGASKNAGANVELQKYVGSSNQKFIIKYISNGYYTIQAKHSNNFLDVEGASKNIGANVDQWPSNYGGDNQKWLIKSAGNDYYYIISKCNDLYMDVEGAKCTNGANIDMWASNGGGDNQKFKFEPVEPSTIDIDESKYPGYKERIEALMEAHPNWNFELLYTGLKFSDVVAGEYSVRKRNLVPTDYGGEWIAGTTLYDTGWYAASEKAIAYYMDPRNFLDDVNVFQFQDVNDYLDGVCTLEGIQAKVSGSFLQAYATDIDTACRNTNVNPYYIIARLFQENGTNPTSGTYKMDGGDGKYYYNPFNIGATGDTKTEVYNNALARAKAEGWDTMEKALEGGIYFCKVNWLDNYQNTLYQNKFDIDTRNGTSLYTHQYMQNLMGAYSEARILRSSYANTGKINSNFTFIIPIYEGMDSTLSPMPVNNAETYAINVRTTGTMVRIREDANIDSKILRELPDKGTVLLSVQRGINSNWQKVITSDGLIGYMSGNYLEQIDDVKTCNYTAKVKTNDGDGCNVRIGPSTRLDKLTALSDGVQVTVIDDSTYKNIDGFDWSRIMLSNGTQAFMPSIFLAR